jgi:hypothetical protein
MRVRIDLKFHLLHERMLACEASNDQNRRWNQLIHLIFLIRLLRNSLCSSEAVLPDWPLKLCPLQVLFVLS